MNKYIDREQAIIALESTPLHIAGVRLGKAIFIQYGERCRGALVDAFKSIPAAEDVEPVRHGFWISLGKTEAGSEILKCSNCGRERRGGGRSKYCRDCGAKMDELERGIYI